MFSAYGQKKYLRIEDWENEKTLLKDSCIKYIIKMIRKQYSKKYILEIKWNLIT